MAVISVSIIESGEQISAGIPRLITINTNIICNVFYTLDGSDPTLFSQIYTETIELPTDQDPVILKILATNGVDSSSIITQEYSSDLSVGVRFKRSATTATPSDIYPNRYPFGTGDIDQNAQFTSSANAGQTVNDPDLAQIPNGFDENGDPANFTNLPLTEENYSLKFSGSDSIGQYGRGIGTIPGGFKVIPQKAPAAESAMYSNLFDPRAMVIFQDVSKENPMDPPHINRASFSLEAANAIDGTYLYTPGPDLVAPSGSFVRSQFNPRDNTITYYYYDNRVNRWIISKAPYQPKPSGFNGELYNIFPARNRALGMVYPWRLFARRVLL